MTATTHYNSDVNSLEHQLMELLNRHSAENASDTPDFILAHHLMGCLEVYSKTLVERERWYGRPIHAPARAQQRPMTEDESRQASDNDWRKASS